MNNFVLHGLQLYFSEKRWVRTEVPEEKGKSSDDKDNSDAETSESEFKFGFGPSGAKPKNKWEEGLYRHLKEKCEKSGKSEEEFEQMLRETDPDKGMCSGILILSAKFLNFYLCSEVLNFCFFI